MENIKCFNEISKKLLEIDNNDKNLGFWKILEKYNLDKIGILSNINNPFIFDTITAVYKFFNTSNDFCIFYTLKRECTK